MVMYVICKCHFNTQKQYNSNEASFYLGASSTSLEAFCGGEHMPNLMFITLDGDELAFAKARFPTLPWRLRPMDTNYRSQRVYGDMARMILGNWED